jgi:hypothetical protein
MAKKIDHIGKALGATRQISVGSRASGPLELLQLGEEIGARLSSKGGRPSDPKWNVRRVIPLKEESWNYLRQQTGNLRDEPRPSRSAASRARNRSFEKR